MIQEKSLNPYLKFYEKLNINIANHQINMQTFQLVAVQIGHVHNTLGVILKDLFKIVGNKFTQTNNLVNKFQIQHKTQKIREQPEKKQQYQPKIIPQSTRLNNFKKLEMLVQKKPEKIIEEENSNAKVNTRDSVSMESNQNAKKFKQKKKSLTRESMEFDNEDSVRSSSIISKLEPIQVTRCNAPPPIQISQFNIQNKSKRVFPELLEQSNDFKQQYSVPVRYNKKNYVNKVNLKGVNCNQCNKFYEATKDISITKLCECSSRHRTNYPQTKIPEYSQLFQI